MANSESDTMKPVPFIFNILVLWLTGLIVVSPGSALASEDPIISAATSSSDFMPAHGSNFDAPSEEFGRDFTFNRVPSFARRYGISCSVCHSVFPALNEYGRLFRAKGYRLPGSGESALGEKPLDLGTEAESQDSNRPLEIPFIDIPATSVASFQILSDFNYRPDERISNEFTGISSVGLIFGGAMGSQFSFFGNVALVEDGKFEGIDRLFIQYNRSLALNLRVGQFEPRAIPFSNHRRLLRITPYLNGVFPMIPAQNFFGFSPNQKGLEAYGRVTGLGGFGDIDYAVGLVNGEPGGSFEVLEEAGGAIGETLDKLSEAYKETGGEYDFNNKKDYYARINYNLWLEGAFSIGSFFYSGTSGFLRDSADNDPSGEGTAEVSSSFVADGNDFNRWGVDVRWDEGRGYFSVLGSIQMFNENLDRPMFNNLSARITSTEIQFYIRPWLVPGFRYERVDLSDFPSVFPDSFERYSADLLVLLASNTMLMIGTTFSNDTAPELPLFEKFSRIALHLAF